jgi:long-chain acyl-CoA synthetase
VAHRRGLRWRSRTYGELRARAFGVARELEALGIAKGERVLLWAGDGPGWIAAFFGCLLRGAVVVPLEEGGSLGFAAKVRDEVGARLLLTDAPDPPPLGLPSLRLRDERPDGASDAASPPLPVDTASTDLVEILFTSGTTSAPKGVCLTHRNILANLAPVEREIRRLAAWKRIFDPVRILSLLPLSHIFGQYMGIFVPHLLGGEVCFEGSPKPADLIDTIRRRRITVVGTVPRQLDTLRQTVLREQGGRGGSFEDRLESAKDRPFLRRAWSFRDVHSRFGWSFWAFVSGAAALPEETEAFWRTLGFAVVQGYGMTEAASLVTANHPFRARARSVGKALEGQEVKLAADGEILVRGANVSPGYWRGGLVPVTDEEGWLHTGDLGEMDESGGLRFRGRGKDLIVTAAGLNVYPEDVEAALAAQPEVEAAAVVGVDGPHGPEALAVVIPSGGETPLGEVVERTNASLEPHQRVRRFLVWPERDFPRTPATRKVRRREVGEWVRSRLQGGPAPPGGSGTGFRALVASIARVNAGRLGDDTRLGSGLGLDSLGRVELLSALEESYQVELDESAVTDATTVGEIEAMVSGRAVPGGSRARPVRYPRWSRRPPTTWVRGVAREALVMPVTRLLCWVRPRHRERLHRLRRPFLLVSNHVTMVDHALILSALPFRLRHGVAIAMDGERLLGWRHPPAGAGVGRRLWGPVLYGLAVFLFDTFPLPKRSGFRRSFAFAGEVVDRGSSLLVFPEGRRTEHGGTNPFMAGIGLMVSGLDVPVVPCRIDGLFERRRRIPVRPGRVSVIFGEPVRYARGEEPGRITADLESRIAALAP